MCQGLAKVPSPLQLNTRFQTGRGMLDLVEEKPSVKTRRPQVNLICYKMFVF